MFFPKVVVHVHPVHPQVHRPCILFAILRSLSSSTVAESNRGVYIAQKLKLFRGHQKLFRGCNIRSLTFTSTVKPHSFEGCHDIYMNISNMTSVCSSGIAALCHVSPSILLCMCTGELSIYSNKWVFLILE